MLFTEMHDYLIYLNRCQHTKVYRDVHVNQINKDGQQLIKNLQSYVKKYNNSYHSVDPFWTRKSDQQVLAALLVSVNGKSDVIRGRNMEVSLPTGSLCAERAAISAALGKYSKIKRDQMKAIAVVDPKFKNVGIEPCGVCQEWLQKIQEESTQFKIYVFLNKEMTYIREYYLTEIINEDDKDPFIGSWTCEHCKASNKLQRTDCVQCGYSNNKKKPKKTPFKDISFTIELVNQMKAISNETKNKDKRGHFKSKDVIQSSRILQKDPQLFHTLIQWFMNRKLIEKKTKKGKEWSLGPGFDNYLKNLKKSPGNNLK